MRWTGRLKSSHGPQHGDRFSQGKRQASKRNDAGSPGQGRWTSPRNRCKCTRHRSSCTSGHRGEVQPLAFHSRRTSGPESRYSAYDLELTSVYHSILHFRHLLEGRKFTIYTDQRPLTSAFFKAREPVSNRQRNQLAVISEFLHRHGTCSRPSERCSGCPNAAIRRWGRPRQHDCASVSWYWPRAARRGSVGGGSNRGHHVVEVRTSKISGSRHTAKVRHVSGHPASPGTYDLEKKGLSCNPRVVTPVREVNVGSAS